MFKLPSRSFCFKGQNKRSCLRSSSSRTLQLSVLDLRSPMGSNWKHSSGLGLEAVAVKICVRLTLQNYLHWSHRIIPYHVFSMTNLFNRQFLWKIQSQMLVSSFEMIRKIEQSRLYSKIVQTRYKFKPCGPTSGPSEVLLHGSL